jgi:hypothetical protein
MMNDPTANPDRNGLDGEFEILLGAFLGLNNNVEAYAGDSLAEVTRAAIENLVNGRMNPDEAHAFLAGLREQPGAVGLLAKRLRETRDAASEESEEN